MRPVRDHRAEPARDAPAKAAAAAERPHRDSHATCRREADAAPLPEVEREIEVIVELGIVAVDRRPDAEPRLAPHAQVRAEQRKVPQRHRAYRRVEAEVDRRERPSQRSRPVDEPRPADECGDIRSGGEGLHHGGDPGRRGNAVRVQPQDHVAVSSVVAPRGRRRDAGLVAPHHACTCTARDGGRGIRRCVVDDDHLVGRARLRSQCTETARELGIVVLDGNDDRDAGRERRLRDGDLRNRRRQPVCRPRPRSQRGLDGIR